MTVKQLSNVLVTKNKNSYICFDSWPKIKSTSSYQWSQGYWKNLHEIENQIPPENQDFLNKKLPKNFLKVFLRITQEVSWNQVDVWEMTFYNCC